MKNIENLVRGYKESLSQDDKNHYRSLAEDGQSPKIMVVGCSDSRVNPDHIFNAAPGELFVVRNVANLVPPFELDEASHGTSAALEFAVKGLNIEHIVIMGHSYCGGVRACCDGVKGIESSGMFVPKWTAILNDCAKTVLSENPDLDIDTLSHKVEQAAIKNSIENLKDFPFIVDGIKAGTLLIHGLYFDIKNAQLYGLDKQSGEFHAL